MRLRHIPGSEEEIEKSPWVYHDPKEIPTGTGHPLHIEIGMGKGRFIIDNAFSYPDTDFIGIEMYESVMIKATRRLDRIEEDERPSNLHFIRMDARDIGDYFPECSVDRIYLNFSDPWPKKRKDNGEIEFKTDNKDLFDFALEEYGKAGFELIYKTYDLHSDTEAMKANIMTEYEEKFSKKGNRIFKYVIRKKNDPIVP